MRTTRLTVRADDTLSRFTVGLSVPVRERRLPSPENKPLSQEETGQERQRNPPQRVVAHKDGENVLTSQKCHQTPLKATARRIINGQSCPPARLLGRVSD